jgi:hypothetical protein
MSHVQWRYGALDILQSPFDDTEGTYLLHVSRPTIKRFDESPTAHALQAGRNELFLSAYHQHVRGPPIKGLRQRFIARAVQRL